MTKHKPQHKVMSRTRGGGATGATAGGWSKMSDEPLAREAERPVQGSAARVLGRGRRRV
jgi:hypothetical protein